MAGAVMTFTETTIGSVKKIKAEWTSDDTTGAVSGTTTHSYSGRIIGAITVPGATAPTDNYDITVTDSDSVDLSLGALQNRATATTQFIAEASMAGIAVGQLTINITNAGNSKIGTVYLFIR